MFFTRVLTGLQYHPKTQCLAFTPAFEKKRGENTLLVPGQADKACYFTRCLLYSLYFAYFGEHKLFYVFCRYYPSRLRAESFESIDQNPPIFLFLFFCTVFKKQIIHSLFRLNMNFNVNVVAEGSTCRLSVKIS